MFKDARQLDRQRTAARFAKDLQKFSSQAEAWFDGTIGSIDRRMAACATLIHSARATVGRLSATESHRYLGAARSLEADHRVLADLRDDMLTGASGRGDASGLPDRRTASKASPAGGLTGVDRRWVELESARFVAANRDALDSTTELTTRATHHAGVHASTFTTERSRALTRAFVAKVTDLGRQSYVPTTVRTAAVLPDFAPEAMFL